MKRNVLLIFVVFCFAFILTGCDFFSNLFSTSLTNATTVTNTTTQTSASMTTTTESAISTSATTLATEIDLTVRLQQIYQLAVDTEVFDGTYEEWLETVRGPEGIPGEDGREITFRVEGEFIQWQYIGDDLWMPLISIPLLIDLEGLEGVGIASIDVNEYGELIITLTDESSVNLGELFDVQIVQFIDYNGYVLNVQHVLHGQSAIAPDNPVRIGHSFTGWSANFNTVTENMVVQAEYSVDTYEIVFEPEGGSQPASIANVEYGTTVTLPIPTKDGYVFSGWYYGPSVNDGQATNSTLITDDVTLYARWDIGQYYIYFNSNGGSLVSPIIQNCNSIIIEPDQPSKFGYSFVGWFLDEALETPYIFDRMPSEDISLYAKWAISEILTVGYNRFDGVFNPFDHYLTDYFSSDADVVKMIFANLLTVDREGGIVLNAIDGEEISREGIDYFYNGISNLGIDYDSTSELTTYTIEIRNDIQFSDGEYMTSDDIIFTYYVLLDPYYEGTNTLNEVGIEGLTNYYYNDSNAEEAKALSEEQAALLIANLGTENEDPGFVAMVINAMYDVLDQEWDWVTTDVVTNQAYANAGYVMDINGIATTDLSQASIAATLVNFYALEDYSVVDKTREQVVQDLTDMYGIDYHLLDLNYGVEITADEVDILAVEYAIADYLDTNPGDITPYITGITKISDTEISITTIGFNAASVHTILDIFVAPMHYYGDESLYDYENNLFGFNSRCPDAMSLIDSKTDAPMGAGPYAFIAQVDDCLYFEANPYYYKGEPKIQYVNFEEVDEEEKVFGIVDGYIDISSLYGSPDKIEEIAQINAETDNSIAISLIDNKGYGYFGINAFNIKVGESPGSDASKALRTGFAVVAAATRYTSIEDYYGETAYIINYPISNTSWAAPNVGEAGYEVAFSKMPDGSAVYTDDPATLADSIRLASAKIAAKAWFEAAGFVFTDTGNASDFGGNIYTIAYIPDGAKDNYEIILPGGGTGNHPSYNLATVMADILADLGFTIDINDPADAIEIWDTLDSYTQEMWIVAWGATIDPGDFMSQVYYSTNVPVIAGGTLDSTEGNHYGIQDAVLDALIVEASQTYDQAVRKELYKECLDIILDWAVEVPVYQRLGNVAVFSTERVNMDTVTPESTPYYRWIDEIEKLEKNESITAQEKLNADTSNLSIINSTFGGQVIDLPAEGGYGSVITWDITTGAEYATLEAGVLTFFDGDAQQTVVITATLCLDSLENTKQFTIIVDPIATQDISVILELTPEEQLIQVQGVVYFFTENAFNIFDGTGMLCIYGPAPEGTLLGDELVIVGNLSFYNNLIEIRNPIIKEKISSDNDYEQTPIVYVPETTELVIGQTYTVIGTVAIEGPYDNVYIYDGETLLFVVYYRSTINDSYIALTDQLDKEITFNAIYYWTDSIGIIYFAYQEGAEGIVVFD